MGNYYRRYADVTSVSHVASVTNDFVVRRRKPGVWVIALLYMASFAALLLLARHIADIGGYAVFAAIGVVVMAFTTWFAIFITQNTRDLALSAEFQNALFSSIANENNLFLLIVKSNGTIVYHSSSYDQVFAAAKKRGLGSIDSLLESPGISEENELKIRNALAEGRMETVTAVLRNHEGKDLPVRLIIKPIARPKGFFTITCAPLQRRAADQRNEVTIQGGHAVAAIPVTIFQQALQELPTGMCIFDAQGKTLFIHQDIEEWLGYDNGEIMAQNIRLLNLLDVPPGTSDSDLELDNYDGDIRFRSKIGTLLTAQVVQRTFQNSDGKIGGCFTLIRPDGVYRPAGTATPLVKKKP